MRVRFVVPALAVLAACVVSGDAFASPTWPPEMLGDAQLHDVCFLDDRRGWAVGDRGVIWHTGNGGQNWIRQLSPVQCRLQSVHFVDADHGWAVGGWTIPYTFRSKGVVLRTINGGQQWGVEKTPALPRLARVGFLDRRHGWAIGYGSALYPTGLFPTSDGGRLWSSVPGQAIHCWAASCFPTPSEGTGVTVHGQVFTLGTGGLRSVPTPLNGPRRVQDLDIDHRGVGFLVGDGGLILKTDDAGQTWRLPPLPLPNGAERHFDFATVAVKEGHVWIAGSPGTTVFHSADGGRRWDTYRAGGPLPIRALTFIDARHGWAVGALGTIRSTADGGATWRRQAGAGSRVAVLGIYGRAESVPWEIVAQVAGNDGYRTRILAVGSPYDQGDFDQVDSESRLHDAAVSVSAAGAEMAWQFPVRSQRLKLPAAQLTRFWSGAGRRQPDAPLAEPTLDEFLVRAIRQWRPDVVLTTSGTSKDADGLPSLVQQSVLRAVQQANSSQAYPQQLVAAGLERWQVKQVFGDVDGGTPNAYSISTAQLVLPLGRSIADLGTAARRLVTAHDPPEPTMVAYRSLEGDGSRGAGTRLLDGIAMPLGSDGRRNSVSAAGGSVQQLRRLAQLRSNIVGLLSQLDRQTDGGARLLGGLATLTGQFDASIAGDILFQVARHFQNTGRADLAAEVLHALIRDYPTHRLSEASLVDLVLHHCSAERRLRHRAVAIEPWTRVQSLEPLIRSTRPELFARPEIRLSLLAAHRAHRRPGEAKRYHPSMLATAPTRWWRACVQGEIWLDDRRDRKPPKPALRCRETAVRPILDGILGDEVWQTEKRGVLHSPLRDDGPWPAAVWLAYDNQFLYLAARCKKAPGVAYPPANGPRPRDPDLSGHDRVQLWLDVNRDYTSYWQLAIDFRGWTGESCVADSMWNPTWYVAAAADQTHWHVEAAIPLTELAADKPVKGQAWAIGIQRTVPGVGYQSWTQPASAEIVRPEGFGYLIFD